MYVFSEQMFWGNIVSINSLFVVTLLLERKKEKKQSPNICCVFRWTSNILKWIGSDELLVARTYRLVPQNRSSIFVTLRLKVSKKSLFRKELTCVLFVILWPLFGVFDELACFHSINNTLAFKFFFLDQMHSKCVQKILIQKKIGKSKLFTFFKPFSIPHIEIVKENSFHSKWIVLRNI